MIRPVDPSDVGQTVLRIVSEAVEADVAPDADLRSLDLSSLTIMRILSRFEDTLGLRVPALLVFEADTVDELVLGVIRALHDATVPRARPPIRALPRRRAARA